MINLLVLIATNFVRVKQYQDNAARWHGQAHLQFNFTTINIAGHVVTTEMIYNYYAQIFQQYKLKAKPPTK